MLHRHRDLSAIARAAADELAILLAGGGSLVLPGGNTPKALFAELVSRGRDFLPWDSIDLWWGDERCVPPTHADSNFGMAKANLIDPLKLDSSLWHRMKGELEPDAAAKAYQEHVYACLGETPVFDVILLGIGSDGHTASIFPDTVIDPDRIVTSTLAPSGQPRITKPRVTMLPRLINAARHVRFLVSGAEKAEALAGIVGNKGNYPAKLIQNADLVWHVDDAAAKGLS